MLIKLKANFPEIVLGAMLTVAVFAMGMAFESSRYQPRNQDPAAQANNSGGVITTKEPENKLTDWLLVLFNGLLFGSTVLLWQANNRSAKIAERALTELERPRVYVEIPTTELRWFISGGFSFNGPIRIKCANHGRSPADLLEFVDDYKFNPASNFPAPIVPAEYTVRILPPGIVAPQGRFYDFTAELPKRMEMPNSGVFTPMDHLFALGYLRYGDIFGRRYIVGYCAVFDFVGQRFVLRGDERYNYHREEK